MTIFYCILQHLQSIISPIFILPPSRNFRFLSTLAVVSVSCCRPFEPQNLSLGSSSLAFGFFNTSTEVGKPFIWDFLRRMIIDQSSTLRPLIALQLSSVNVVHRSLQHSPQPYIFFDIFPSNAIHFQHHGLWKATLIKKLFSSNTDI